MVLERSTASYFLPNEAGKFDSAPPGSRAGYDQMHGVPAPVTARAPTVSNPFDASFARSSPSASSGISPSVSSGSSPSAFSRNSPGY